MYNNTNFDFNKQLLIMLNTIITKAINDIDYGEISTDVGIAYDEGQEAGKIIFARKLLLDLYKVD